jgi:hypothetical protein
MTLSGTIEAADLNAEFEGPIDDLVTAAGTNKGQVDQFFSLCFSGDASTADDGELELVFQPADDFELIGISASHTSAGSVTTTAYLASVAVIEGDWSVTDLLNSGTELSSAASATGVGQNVEAYTGQHFLRRGATYRLRVSASGATTSVSAGIQLKARPRRV